MSSQQISHKAGSTRPASLVLALAMAGLMSLTLTACGKDDKAAAPTAEQSKPALDPMEVVVPAEMAGSFKTAPVTQA